MSIRKCKMCDILESIPEDVAAHVEKLYAIMPDNEKADDHQIKKRMAVCTACENNQSSTCLKCGCYVQFRVLSKHNKCPVKKW